MNDKIERGKKIPPPLSGTRWAQLADRMPVGGSKVLDCDNDVVGLRYALRKRGKTAVQRKLRSGKIRVWVVSKSGQ
jgi:hypothetical protein